MMGAAFETLFEQLIERATDRAAQKVITWLERHKTPAVLTQEEICFAMQISQPTLAKEIARGMPHFYQGDHKRFVLADVLAWAKKNRLEQAK